MGEGEGECEAELILFDYLDTDVAMSLGAFKVTAYVMLGTPCHFARGASTRPSG